MTIVPRDQSLDSELESGAHLTLILVAIGLAFLFTATAVIFYLFPVYRIMRRTLFPRRPGDDPTQVQRETGSKEVFRPRMTSTPRGQLPLPQRMNGPCHQPPRSPVFFATRHPVLPHTPNASYNTQTPRFYNHWMPPPNRSHTNPHYHPLPPPQPSIHVKITPNDVAGWMMRIADDVVGRHPSAKPLRERVATRAEIDLVSGHVCIPWAHELWLGGAAQGTAGGCPLTLTDDHIERHAPALVTIPKNDSILRVGHRLATHNSHSQQRSISALDPPSRVCPTRRRSQ